MGAKKFIGNVSRTMAKSTSGGIVHVAGLYNPKTWKEKGLKWVIGLMIVTYIVVVGVIGVVWSRHPGLFDVHRVALASVGGDKTRMVAGLTVAATMIHVVDTLLHKTGGFIRNDMAPPGVYLDNMSNWEHGAIDAVRDMARAMRNDFSRSQSQSVEDKDLVEAQTLFNNDSTKWIFPSAEKRYGEGIDYLNNYVMRLTDEQELDGQFFTRADNLRNYLQEVEKRLGGFGHHLGASVGEMRFDTELAGDPNAEQSTPTPAQKRVQTSWFEIDDVFYKARGYTWALLHFLRAIKSDFTPVLKDKNALVSMSQIIRELEGAQQLLWSPMILNGTGFGVVANHSLVLASYISRANAAVIDLRSLLKQG